MSKAILEENKLLKNWISTPLKNLITDNVSYGILKNGEYDPNGIRMLRVMDISDIGTLNDTNIFRVSKDIEKKYARTRLLEGNVVLSVAATLGRSMIIPKELEGSNVNRALAVIRLNELILPKFLHFFIKSSFFIDLIRDKKVGTAQQVINLRDLANFLIPIPPLNEQKRIVAKIEELFSKLDVIMKSLTEIRIRIDQYRHSFIRWIFFGDYKERFHASSEWKHVKIGEVYDIIGGGTPSTKNPKYWGGKTPWITSADIYGIRDIQPRRTVTPLGIDNSTTSIIPPNSILVVTRVGLGKLAITTEKLCINQDIQALLERDDSIDQIFALHYLSEMVQSFKYQSRGTTINGVTKKQLYDLSFVIPPLIEQKMIVSFIETHLSQLSNIERVINENIVLLTSMKRLILRLAFEGKLVPQDPNDEPAEILLEKIKLEKQKTVNQSTKSRKKNGK